MKKTFKFLSLFIIISSISCKQETKNQEESNFDIESLVGKWKIKRSRTISSGKNLNDCNIYSFIFSKNGSFSIEFENSYTYGQYFIEDKKDVLLRVNENDYGSLTNIVIENGEISFSISVINLCNENINAIKDYAYKDDENCILDLDVQIGNQFWMTKNLNTTQFNNGDPIPFEPNIERWYNLNTPAYTYYNNNADNISTYGLLYNWYALNDKRGIAPNGYRIPSKADYEELTKYLGLDFLGNEGYSYEENKGVAEKLKSLSYWNFPNDNNNESCFDALPGGFIDVGEDGGGGFGNLGGQGVFWTNSENPSDATRAYYFILSYPSIGQQVGQQLFTSNIALDLSLKTQGFSIRCIKN